MKNINIEEVINKLEIYQLNNKDLPYLMREYPYIHDLAVNLLYKELNLTLIENKTDYLFMLLAQIANNAIIKIDTNNYIYDKKLFFTKLEDILYNELDLSHIRVILSYNKRFNKEKKINMLQKKNEIKVFYNFLKLFGSINLFGLFQIKQTKENMYNYNEINHYKFYINSMK